jgi:hypothetical protein
MTEVHESTIGLSHQRDADGKVTVTALLFGGQAFKRSIWVQEAQERASYLNDLVAECPGIASERKIIRAELQKIARATEIDLRFEPLGHVNGSARYSARLWSGSRVIETVPVDLFNPSSREKGIKHLAPFLAGRNAGKRKLVDAENRLRRLFTAEFQRVASMPAQRPQGFDPLRAAGEIPYELVDGVGIIWRKKLLGGGEMPTLLTNFTAKITATVWRTDGVDRGCEYEVEAAMRGKAPRRFIVKQKEFEEMSWPGRELGAEAGVEPENGFERRTAAAIRKLSGEILQRVLYTHTGWMKLDDVGYVYLHAGGIISAVESPPSIQVALDSGVANYLLPAPPQGEELRTAIRASLRMLEMAPGHVVYPPYCLIWRSILRRSKFMVHVVGRTGTFKSELTALCQQHFGAAMDATNLPGAWRSTANALGEMLFLAKDVLFTIDDYKLKGSPKDRQSFHDKADDVIRGTANGTGKQRMRAEGGLRSTKAPRSSILSSGEHVPDGESCRARQLITEVSPDDIEGGDWLGSFQRDAARGLYAAATAGFVRWLCEGARIEKVREDLSTVIPNLRTRAEVAGVHRRTPEIVANLYAGLLHFLEFAQEKRAISDDEAKRLRDEAWSALVHVAAQQKDHQTASEPVTRYLDLIMSALGSGRAHLAGADGAHPGDEIAAACGWWKRGAMWEPRGTRIGWITREGIFLDPDAAYEAAQSAAGGHGFVEPESDLRKRLDEKGLLITSGGEFNRRTVRRLLEGAKRWVLWLKSDALGIPCAGDTLSCARPVRPEEH